jgi:serine protease Do
MSNRSIAGWLIAIVFLGVLVGIIGGGLTGGLVGYYALLNRAPVIAPAAATAQSVSMNPSSSSNPSATAAPPAGTNLTVNEDSAIIDTVKKVEPAVVTVINTLDHPAVPFGQQVAPTASGSGVIIDAQGHIITNNHVVDGAQRLDVIFADGSKAQAQIVGTDPVSDLAVIQVSAKVPAAAPLGDSNALQLGERVIAIGSPLGSYRGSVTVGVVSGLNRTVDGTNQEGLIQTDAAINHGNSGGPLVNLSGQVVGINTLVVRDTSSGDIAEGLGFAIPSNTVRDVSQQLIASGKIDYPFIGIGYTQNNPQTAGALNLSATGGVIVQDVTPGSPAADAGLQPNDIVLAIDGNNIDQDHSLRSILFKYRIGDQVTLQVQRGSQTLSVKLTLVARPPGS